MVFYIFILNLPRFIHQPAHTYPALISWPTASVSPHMLPTACRAHARYLESSVAKSHDKDFWTSRKKKNPKTLSWENWTQVFQAQLLIQPTKRRKHGQWEEAPCPLVMCRRPFQAASVSSWMDFAGCSYSFVVGTVVPPLGPKGNGHMQCSLGNMEKTNLFNDSFLYSFTDVLKDKIPVTDLWNQIIT